MMVLITECSSTHAIGPTLGARIWLLQVVTSPLWRIGSCTGPTAAVDRKLQNCQLGVKQYLFFSGVIDKEQEGEGKRKRVRERTLQQTRIHYKQ